MPAPGDIVVTHPERVIDGDITKGDVVAYYRDVAEVMLPELARRALTLERFTKGLAAGGFYQKHWQKHYPDWIAQATLNKVTYPVCDTPAALVYFANQGGLAYHVWTSRVDEPMHPDVLVFDLDPPDNGFEMVRVTARLLATFAHRRDSAPPAQPVVPLTDREEQVLVSVARGRTNAEIATELFISLSTVKTHLGSLMNKLGARNRVEIAMWAYETRRIGA